MTVLPSAKNDARDRDIVVQVAPHPFAVERVTHVLPAGASLAEILQNIQPDAVLRRHAYVFIDGEPVPPQNWPRVRPKPGVMVTVRMVPMGGGGGGGKNPLRTVLSIAILAASPAIAAGISGALGASGAIFGISTAKLISTGVNLLGRLALNALAPPPRPRFAGRRENPVYFLQGAQNRLQPFSRVPKVLGRHRFVPPFGATPYTETVGNDQYLRLLFVWGYGPLQISDLRIGETPLSEFEGVEIETREGYDDDEPLTLYSNAVLQNDMQVALRAESGGAIRTTEAEADEISVDITFPRGLFQMGGGGGRIARTVEIGVEYAPTGTTDWTTGPQTPRSLSAQQAILPPLPRPAVEDGRTYVTARYDRISLNPMTGEVVVTSGTVHRLGLDAGEIPQPPLPEGRKPLALVLRRSDHPQKVPAGAVSDERGRTVAGIAFSASGDFAVTPSETDHAVDVAAGSLTYRALIVTAQQSTTLRRAVTFKVPRGQYDVRVSRLTPDTDNENIFDECHWTALRTIRSVRPVRMQGLAMTAMRIRATDQLSGMIERFNGVVQSIIPDWNGEDWVMRATSNPASLYRHVLQGAGNARPLADYRIDLARLVAWHARCEEAGREFNAVLDHDISVRDVLQDVAAVGRASPAIIDGRWSVVEDLPQNVPVQHFTPRNSFAFEAQKAFTEMPQALRVRFVNRDKGWTPDERLVFIDGVDETTATDYETLDLTGVTSAGQAWKDGRYHLAVARLRPETYQFSTDIEHLVCTRGDLIRVTHDVPMFGLQSARVVSVDVDDEDRAIAVTLDAAVEMAAGKTYALRIRRNDGGSLVTQVKTEAGEKRHKLTFQTPIPAGQVPTRGDLAMFGISGLESVAMVVKAIEPQGDLTARLTCVDAAPEIHAADAGEIPDFQSQITLNDRDRPPPAPEVLEIQSGEESLIRHTDGSLTTRVVVTLKPPVYSLPLRLQVMIRGVGETAFRPADILSQTETQISIVGVEEEQRYDLKLRYVTQENNRSSARIVSGYEVRGTSSLPSDVEGFSVSLLGEALHFSWAPVRDIDLSHYTLRFTPETGSVGWAKAVDIVSRIPMDSTSLSLPAAAGNYLLKAVDVGGRLSETAAVVHAPQKLLNGHNRILTIQESPAFLGEKTGVVRSGSALRLDSLGTMDDWEDLDEVENVDLGADGLRVEGVYAFSGTLDLGAVAPARLTAVMHVEGIDLNWSIDQWPDVDLVEFWDDNIDPSVWRVDLEIRTTTEPPLAGEWTDWMPFVVGDYIARACEFRVRLTSNAHNISPMINRLEVHVDMPDRLLTGRGVTAPSGGMTVAFEAPFYDVPAVFITPHGLQSGEIYTVSAVDESGFFIRFFNSSGSGVARTFDYAARGTGRFQ